jgi:hypothetical protein
VVLRKKVDEELFGHRDITTTINRSANNRFPNDSFKIRSNKNKLPQEFEAAEIGRSYVKGVKTGLPNKKAQWEGKISVIYECISPCLIISPL